MHSSSTVRVPRTFTSYMWSVSAGRIETTPATWKTRSTPFIARRTAALSSTSQVTVSASTPSRFSQRERRRHVRRRSSPRFASSLTSAEPTKPFPPVTSVLATLEERPPAGAQLGVVLLLVPDAGKRLGDRLEPSRRDLLAVDDALAVRALLETLLSCRDVLRLILEDRDPRLVELLLER